jgi:hypothetical protein
MLTNFPANASFEELAVSANIGINEMEGLRPCPWAQFFSLKMIKTFLPRLKKAIFGGLAGVALSRG